MRILWVGPFFSDEALRVKRATNQAAAKWSRGLLQGLKQNGCEIRVISHCTEQRWPRGNVVWQDDSPKWFLDWFPCERIAYCNVVGVKERWLEWAYARAAKKLFKVWTPDVVLCYNSLHSCNVAVMKMAAKRGIKNVPIILDGDDPRCDNWKKLLHDNRFADGVVFLSYWMYQHYPNQTIPLLHMDGGADAFKGVRSDLFTSASTPKTYTLVHTGALDYWRGLDFMKKLIKCCKRRDVRFVFCGKCDRKAMLAEFDNDERVDVKGFVCDDELDKICRSADVFLNVRTPGIGDNLVNYPSKVPQYLAWGKPVVSTWNDSFSSDYRDVLEVSDDTSEGFARTIDATLAWTAAQRDLQFDKIRNWFVTRKSWARQAGRLKDYISDLSK